MTSHRIRIHFAHADPVVNTGLLAMLESEEGLDLSTSDQLGPFQDAVIIADYYSGVRLGRQASHSTGSYRQRVLIVTHHDNNWEVHCATESGVHGYMLQSDVPDELLNAVRVLAGGGRYLSRTLKLGMLSASGGADQLTGREHEVLQLLGMGYCNKLIARELGISLSTVKSHMKAVLMKLNVSARTHAVIVATQRGLLRIDFGAGGARGKQAPVPSAR